MMWVLVFQDLLSFHLIQVILILFQSLKIWCVKPKWGAGPLPSPSLPPLPQSTHSLPLLPLLPSPHFLLLPPLPAPLHGDTKKLALLILIGSIQVFLVWWFSSIFTSKAQSGWSIHLCEKYTQPRRGPDTSGRKGYTSRWKPVLTKHNKVHVQLLNSQNSVGIYQPCPIYETTLHLWYKDSDEVKVLLKGTVSVCLHVQIINTNMKN